jgi:hypothetical protein
MLCTGSLQPLENPGKAVLLRVRYTYYSSLARCAFKLSTRAYDPDLTCPFQEPASPFLLKALHFPRLCSPLPSYPVPSFVEKCFKKSHHKTKVQCGSTCRSSPSLWLPIPEPDPYRNCLHFLTRSASRLPSTQPQRHIRRPPKNNLYCIHASRCFSASTSAGISRSFSVVVSVPPRQHGGACGAH